MTKRWKNFARRGIALPMVLTVLAVTATLGFAMLSSASLQVQSSGNATYATAADSLAESGVNLAAYYLQYPTNAPSLNATGFWGGQNGISFGSSVVGTVDVTVACPSSNVYNVTAIGHCGAISRTATSQIIIRPTLTFNYGASFSGNTTIPAGVTINGPVQSNGIVTNLGNVTGTIFASSLINHALFTLIFQPLSAILSQTPITSLSNLNNYLTYTYQGATYNATVLSSGSINANTTLGPSASNPAGIYYHSGGLNLNSNITINGTLINDGSITIQGSNIVINSVSGFPALEVRTGDLIVKVSLAQARGLTAHGVSWLGGSMKTSGVGLNGALVFDGAVVFGNGGGVDAVFLGTVNITFNTAQAKAPGLDNSMNNPGVKFYTWKQ